MHVLSFSCLQVNLSQMFSELFAFSIEILFSPEKKKSEVIVENKYLKF